MRSTKEGDVEESAESRQGETEDELEQRGSGGESCSGSARERRGMGAEGGEKGEKPAGRGPGAQSAFREEG